MLQHTRALSPGCPQHDVLSLLLTAGLFPKDELDMIINDMRPIMKAAAPGVPDTWDNLYAFFLNRVRDNLHVMLCFSPVGNKFSRRAMQFPGLINGCTIDWFLPWPEEALTSGEGDGALACPAMCLLNFWRLLMWGFKQQCHQFQDPTIAANKQFACDSSRAIFNNNDCC